MNIFVKICKCWLLSTELAKWVLRQTMKRGGEGLILGFPPLLAQFSELSKSV